MCVVIILLLRSPMSIQRCWDSGRVCVLQFTCRAVSDLSQTTHFQIDQSVYYQRVWRVALAYATAQWRHGVCYTQKDVVPATLYAAYYVKSLARTLLHIDRFYVPLQVPAEFGTGPGRFNVARMAEGRPASLEDND